jgi:hypothetical protein
MKLIILNLSHHGGVSLSIVTSLQNKVLDGLRGGPLPKPGHCLSTNNTSVAFSRSNWAMPGVHRYGSIGGANDPRDFDITRRIMATYSVGANNAMQADI